jgi:hypothetical protein
LNIPKLKPYHSETKAYLRRRQRAYERKVAEYAAFLKDDCDFDFVPILAILRYKIQRTEKHIRKHNIIADADKTCEGMRTVIDLLGRVVDDKYEEQALAPFRAKYGKPKMVIKKPSKPMRNNPHAGSEIEFLYRGKPATPEMRKEMRRLLKQAGKRKVGDLRKALGIMADKVFEWWD